ncbi:MAG: aspartate kinase [Bacteroidetes bacterium]|nr:MAG: aspartate kinase [Bacteroidota bacterium]
MKKGLKVFKFGGASLKNAAGMRHVATILQRFAKAHLVIIASATEGTTNALELVVQLHQAGKSEEALAQLHTVRQAHYDIARELLGEQHDCYDQLNDHLVAVEWVLDEEPHENYDYIYDQIVSVGELLSTQILAAYLNQAGLPTHWLDARDVVLTDDIFREGWVQWEETEERAVKTVLPLLDQGGFVLTQGFIGSTTENFTTTLGRDGSDYSAAIFSYCLDAEGMYIWKDVPGILTADPRLFDNVIKLDRLSYREAIEMTYYGAKVIHPKTIKPLQNKNIPLYVKSFIDPDGAGSVISDEIVDKYPPIVTVEKKQALCTISARDFSFVAEHHIKRMFESIAELRLQVNMMQNTALSFNVCFNDVDDKVDRFAQALEKDFKVMITRDLETITIRHYDQLTLDSMKRGKMVLVEERLPQTILMVVKTLPVITRKEEVV